MHRMICPVLCAFNPEFMLSYLEEVVALAVGEVSSRTIGCLTSALIPLPADVPETKCCLISSIGLLSLKKETVCQRVY